MQKCACSTRALEIVAKDLAGLSLRQRRAQLYFQRCRLFSTRTPSRQTESIKSAAPDDGFIPFEVTGKLRAITVQDDAKQAAVEESEHHRDADTNAADSEFQDLDLDDSVRVEIRPGVMAVAAEVDAQFEEKPASRGTVPDWAKPADQKPKSTKQRMSLGQTQSGKPISVARKARRERRLAEGKLKPSSESKVPSKDEEKAKNKEMAPEQDQEQQHQEQQRVHNEEDADTDQVHTVLAKLDRELGGPSIVQAQQTRASKLAAKSIEKKRKAQVTAAAKLEAERRAAIEAETARKKTLEPWRRDKYALQQKFGAAAWAPRKRLSPDSLDGIRALHASDPATYTTAMLSEHFQVTPEAIRRILKSKWRPKPEEMEDRRERWEKRGVKKWREMSEIGMKPPKKWRVLHGVPNPKLEVRKKWEGGGGEGEKKKPVNAKTGKKERWRNLEKSEGGRENDRGGASLADRL